LKRGVSRSSIFGAIINLKLTHLALVCLLILLSAALCAAQTASGPEPTDANQSAQPPPATSPPAQNKPGDQPPAQSDSKDQNTSVKEDTEKKKNDRMFYVMPNYLTVDGQSQVPPVSWKEKFAMAAKGSFDPYEFTIIGIVSGIRQAENSDEEFGQGMKGYAKRYGAAFTDQVDGNIMVGGVFPTILKIDPRYYRLGRGPFVHRFGYAISRIFVARKDSGGSVFNTPEFAGNATAIAISNAYYPADDRAFSPNINNWGVQMGLDALGNELKEFWPDVHNQIQKWRKHHQKQMSTD